MSGNFFSGLIGRIFSREEPADLPAPESGVDDFLAAFASTMPDFLQWEWDDQHDGVVAILEIDAAHAVLAVLDVHCPGDWDRSSIRRAPALVRRARRQFGGLQAKQRIFASALADDVLLLGLWWPWGHGGSVSIRLVPFGPDAAPTELAAARDALRRAFTQV